MGDAATGTGGKTRIFSGIQPTGSKHLGNLIGGVRQYVEGQEIGDSILPEGDPVHLPAALATAFGLSTSEARRLIGQGGVKLGGEVVRELDVARAALRDATVQAGKRRFTRFREPADA